MRLSLSSWVLGSLFLLHAAPALAGGIDTLRDSAKAAVREGNTAQAVADLRRARESVLAESKDAELLAELQSAEQSWLVQLTQEAEHLPLERRPGSLLALRDEAVRIKNPAEASILTSLDQSLTAIWESKRTQADEADLALLFRLQATEPRAPSVTRILGQVRAQTEKKAASFATSSPYTQYVAKRLRYFYRLDDAAPSDPNPVRFRLQDGPAWMVGDCGNTLAEVAKSLRAQSGSDVSIRVDSATCTEGKRDRSSQHPVTWMETVKVPRTERVVVSKPVRRWVEVPGPLQCSTSTEVENLTGVGLRITRTTQSCANGPPRLEPRDELVDTVEYRQHVDSVERQMRATPASTIRTSTLKFSLRATLQAGDDTSELRMDDEVGFEHEEYSHPKGGSASFDPNPRAKLNRLFADRVAAAMSEAARRTLQTRRARELRSELGTQDGPQKDATLSELLVIEGNADPELVRRVASATTLPADAITRALRGEQIAVASAYAPSSPYWTLPKPNPAGERDAFEAEDREYLADHGIDKSVYLSFGGGAITRSGGAPYGYFDVNLYLEKTPSFSLFRWYSLAGFVEGAVGVGEIKHFRGSLGVQAGAHLGPLLLRVVGAAGADAYSLFLSDDEVPSPNATEIPGAVAAGYGLRGVLRAGGFSFYAAARREHRLSDTFKFKNSLEFGVADTFGVLARFETYGDLLEGGYAGKPWALSGGIGVMWDVQTTEAGELSGRTQ